MIQYKNLFLRTFLAASALGLGGSLVGGVSYSQSKTFGVSAGAAKVTSIEFKGTADPSEIDISTEGNPNVDKQVSSSDKQVILTIAGATLAPGAKRSIDTSSFNGQVSLISPYQSSSDPAGVKIVIQLRSDVDVTMSQENGMIRLNIPNQAGSDATSDLSSPEAGAKNQAAQEEMDKALKSLSTKEFTGKPITLQVREIDVRDVFNLIAETSGFNIVLAPDVTGNVSLSLVDVPWDQALDVVMQTMKLGADRKGNVLRIMTLDGLAKEIDLQQKLKLATEAVEPRKTEIFPISYAKLSDLSDNLSRLIGIENAPPANAAAKAAVGAGAAGAAAATLAGVNNPAALSNSAASKLDVKIITDERTNSLIVWAIPSVMDRIRKMIAILDTQTPQIMLEGKVIEASEQFSRNINGGLGTTNFGVSGSVPYGGSFNGGPLLTSPATIISGLTGASSGSTPGGSFGTQIIPFGQNISATLSVGEAESKVKLIASPKEVVLNKQNATITQGTPVYIPTTGIGPNGGIVSTATVTDANLTLNVTPTVTGDGSVLMDLTLSRDEPEALAGASTPGQEGIATNSITTHVLVDSGSTLVLGGFFVSDDSHTNSGFPVLRDLPILGWLFSSDTKTINHDELFFFITPTVVNPKKAGLQKT